jgi:hypothetical protein
MTIIVKIRAKRDLHKFIPRSWHFSSERKGFFSDLPLAERLIMDYILVGRVSYG